jgi:LysM repeat protein
VVRSGDTLARIAAKSGISWQELYAANREVIGDDPGLIYPGQSLRIG